MKYTYIWFCNLYKCLFFKNTYFLKIALVLQNHIRMMLGIKYIMKNFKNKRTKVQ